MASMIVLAVAALFIVSCGAIPLSTDIKTPVTRQLEKGMRTFSSNIPFNDPSIIGYNAKGNEVSQIHLTPGGKNEMVVAWNTNDYKLSTGAPVPYDPTSVPGYVYYGRSTRSLTKVATATGEVYSQHYGAGTSYYEGLIAENYTSGIQHTAVLTGLSAGLRYYYKVGYGSYKSSVQSFRMLNTATKYPQRIAVVADWGTSYNSSTTLTHMLANLPHSLPNPPAAFYIGDFCYADTWYINGVDSTNETALQTGRGFEGNTSATYQPVWDHWMKLIQPLVAQVPMLGTPGNHEIEQETTGNYSIFQSVQARWKFDSMGAASGGTWFYYSKDIGPVHAIFISPYTDYTPGSAMYQWLYFDLRSVKRSKTPWVTISIHHPVFTSDPFSYKEHEHLRVSLEPLAYKFGVDVWFYGHVHSYERTAPMYDYNVDECGAVHLTVGDGGNSEGASFFLNQHTYNLNPDGNLTALDFADVQCPNVTTVRPSYMNSAFTSPIATPFSWYKRVFTFQADGNTTGTFTTPGYCYAEQPTWSQIREPSFGHGILDVINSTTALWSWYRNQDSVATVGDQVYLVRNPKKCPNKAGFKAYTP